MGGRIATMIVTVTLNAALDVAYDVEALVPHATHRVLEVRARAGGKGVNVARVLRQLGQDAVVTGLAGGHTGTLIRADLAASGLPDALVPISRESRRTLAIVSRRDGGATLLNEPGPQVREEEWAGLLARFDRLLAAAQAVMLSGSLPVGVPTAPTPSSSKPHTTTDSQRSSTPRARRSTPRSWRSGRGRAECRGAARHDRP